MHVYVFVAVGHASSCFNYRPQRSWAKVIFSQACVKNSVHGGGVCLSACWDIQTPPPQTRQTPPNQADPPRPGRHPQTRQTPPRPGRPPQEADSRTRSTSGRYASYWNAFLFLAYFCTNTKITSPRLTLTCWRLK